MEAAKAECVLLVSLHLAPVAKESAVGPAFQAEFPLILHEFHDYLLPRQFAAFRPSFYQVPRTRSGPRSSVLSNAYLPIAGTPPKNPCLDFDPIPLAIEECGFLHYLQFG